MFLQLFELLPPDHDGVSMAPLCPTAPAWKPSESSALTSTLSLLANALKIAAALFTREKAISNGFAAIEGTVVRDDVSAAMTVLSDTLHSVEGQPELPEAAKELLRLVFPSYRGWFGAARRACSLAAADILGFFPSGGAAASQNPPA